MDGWMAGKVNLSRTSVLLTARVLEQQQSHTQRRIGWGGAIGEVRRVQKT
jgi:hypothetical protein